MSNAYLEHANLTVRDPDKSAALLCELFDWTIRWSGSAKDNGYTVHVGNEESYLALYTPSSAARNPTSSYREINHLNHLGVVVDDLDELEKRVKEAGLLPFNHGNYEPGRRFYFEMHNDLEIEVVSYQ
jgi:hypothetical protein